MKDINIASSTALDTLSPYGRIRAIESGANVLMPNLTPHNYRDEYFLYDGKSTVLEADELIENIKSGLKDTPFNIAFGELGDSKHFLARQQNL
jgi:biotin synthase